MIVTVTTFYHSSFYSQHHYAVNPYIRVMCYLTKMGIHLFSISVFYEAIAQLTSKSNSDLQWKSFTFLRALVHIPPPEEMGFKRVKIRFSILFSKINLFSL